MVALIREREREDRAHKTETRQDTYDRDLGRDPIQKKKKNVVSNNTRHRAWFMYISGHVGIWELTLQGGMAGAGGRERLTSKKQTLPKNQTLPKKQTENRQKGKRQMHRETDRQTQGCKQIDETGQDASTQDHPKAKPRQDQDIRQDKT